MSQQLLDIAAKFGTPLYVYDAAVMRENIRVLRDNLPGVEIHYACKALTNQSILRLIREWGCGIDAVSREEVDIALKCGFAPHDINFTPSGSPLDAYLWCMDKGVQVHVDNAEILSLIGQKRKNAEVVLRFNPNIRLGGHRNIQVGAGDSKFGLHRHEVKPVNEIIRKLGIRVIGMHIHVGSDVQYAGEFIEVYKYIFGVARTYAEDLRLIDVGGGFKVPYVPWEKSPDMHLLGEELTRLREEFKADTGKSIRLVIEPGKFITSNAGYLLVEVTALKPIRSRTIAYVNSGFNHLIRPMYYGARHMIRNLSNTEGEEREYLVAGYLCETDTFADRVTMNTVHRGDILCFYNAGAYAITMASNYNSRPRPAEVLIKNGEARMIRRKETLKDLLRLEV